MYAWTNWMNMWAKVWLDESLNEKGVNEYLQAAMLVKKQRPEVVFQLAGQFDLNPGAIKKRILRSYMRKGIIEYLGSIDNICSALGNCKCFVLPSYREGLPRSTLEALSTGRPIITTDAIGCKDTIRPGINGLQVPIGNTKALANAMLKILDLSQDKIQEMGDASYDLAKNYYDVKKVNNLLLKELDLN